MESLGSSVLSHPLPVQVLLAEYDGLDQLKADVRATVANTILGHVDEFWRDDEEAHDHVRSRVEFDEAHVQHEFELSEADGLEIETVTKLGIATEGSA